jgi:hypothetical protein
MAAVLAHRQRSSAALLLAGYPSSQSPNSPSPQLLCVCSKKLKWYALCPVVDAINHSSLVQVGALHSIPVLPHVLLRMQHVLLLLPAGARSSPRRLLQHSILAARPFLPLLFPPPFPAAV